MNLHRIVAIITFFNRQQSLLATLRGVEAQTLLPTQLILVDDGSTDHSADVAIDWLKQMRSRFDCRLLRTANGGAAAARNYGLSLSQPSEYVAFLDSDDHWPPDFLERTQAALATSSTAIAASRDRRYVFADGRKSKLEDCSSIVHSPSIWLLERGAGVGSSTLFRRSEVESQGGFDVTLPTGHDAALFLRLTVHGSWLHVAGRPVEYSIGLAQQLGDEGNLSSKYADNHLAWVQIYTDFFVHGSGQALLNHPRVRRLLAKRWYYAGRQLFQLGERRQALACFRKSNAWKPWNVRCYGYAWRAWLASGGGEIKNMYFDSTGTTPALSLVKRAA